MSTPGVLRFLENPSITNTEPQFESTQIENVSNSIPKQNEELSNPVIINNSEEIRHSVSATASVLEVSPLLVVSNSTKNDKPAEVKRRYIKYDTSFLDPPPPFDWSKCMTQNVNLKVVLPKKQKVPDDSLRSNGKSDLEHSTSCSPRKLVIHIKPMNMDSSVK